MVFCIIDRDSRLRAVNELFASLAGRPTTQLLGTHADETGVITRDDVAGAFWILDAGGTIPEKEIRRQGKDYVVSIYGLPNACGDTASICAYLRDISLRKGLERRLEAANSKLAEMNVKDYLTRVANRRHFDETLLKEVGRLAREGGFMCVAMGDGQFQTLQRCLWPPGRSITALPALPGPYSGAAAAGRRNFSLRRRGICHYHAANRQVAGTVCGGTGTAGGGRPEHPALQDRLWLRYHQHWRCRH